MCVYAQFCVCVFVCVSVCEGQREREFYKDNKAVSLRMFKYTYGSSLRPFLTDQAEVGGWLFVIYSVCNEY